MPVYRIRIAKEEIQKFWVVDEVELLVEGPDEETVRKALEKALDYQRVEALCQHRVYWLKSSAEKIESQVHKLEAIKDVVAIGPYSKKGTDIPWTTLETYKEK